LPSRQWKQKLNPLPRPSKIIPKSVALTAAAVGAVIAADVAGKVTAASAMNPTGDLNPRVNNLGPATRVTKLTSSVGTKVADIAAAVVAGAVAEITAGAAPAGATSAPKVLALLALNRSLPEVHPLKASAFRGRLFLSI